ncbi:hypothetical protein Cgig2_013555 [Carnegiea gigantea]|uniref:Uncharacterized protein n=1 Tax=Carnegiea gigantea TaxID=171969 RepID=A0A9Q1GUB8_9CARY|nr:hypothetical protein Cgig2_013555 [Carnegiea gigantea]
MQVDRGKQRVITELGMRASKSVSTQVYSRRNSFRNRRNRVRESNGCSSEGSVYKIWPPDALLVCDTSSPSTDEAKGVDPALYEAKICGQATSNSFVPLARDDVVSHQIHRENSNQSILARVSKSQIGIREKQEELRNNISKPPFSMQFEFSPSNRFSHSLHVNTQQTRQQTILIPNPSALLVPPS